MSKNDENSSGFIPNTIHGSGIAIFFSDPAGLAALSRVITKQAELVAYIADFRLLAVLIFVCIPIVFIMQNPLTNVTVR